MGLRVVAAEDSYLIREALGALFATQPDIDLIATVDDLPSLIEVVGEQEPDVVITDIRMPPGDTDEGVVAAETFARTRPDLGVVVLSQYVEAEWALRVFESGASGRAYLLKERVGDVAQLRAAITTVHGGGSVLDPLVVEALVAGRREQQASPLGRLTVREEEVMGLVARGHSNSAIAAALGLSGRAVEKHVTSVLAKLDLPVDDTTVNRRVRAVLLYLSDTAA